MNTNSNQDKAPQAVFTFKAIAANVFQTPILRNLFFSCLAIALFFPTLHWLCLNTDDYYLITLFWRNSWVIAAITTGIMALSVLILFKASQAILIHKHMDLALQKARDELEIRIHERTQDLFQANKKLQMEILERQQTEKKLSQSEKQYRALVETMPHGMIEIDAHGIITFVNPAHANLYGYEQKALIGKPLYELAANEKERKQRQQHLHYLIQYQPHPRPWFNKDMTQDGNIIETQVDWTYKRDAQGHLTGLVAVISDITHRKNAEKALRDNLRFMNTLIDTIPNPVFYKDTQGVFIGCNTAYTNVVLGLPKDQILGRRLIDFPHLISSTSASRYHEHDMDLIRNPGVQTYEAQLRCADGKRRDYLYYNATFRDTEGQVAGLVGIMLDISTRKQVEKALAESKNLFDVFMQHMPGLAFIKDLQGRYLFVNKAYAKFTGTPAAQQIGKSDNEIWDSQTAAIIHANDKTAIHSQTVATKMETLQLPDQAERRLLTTRFPIFQDKSLFAIGGVSIDVTERTFAEQQQQKLELQLQQAQKMEALGTLAGGIAHDFNNILSAIIGYTEIALTEIDKGDALYKDLTRVWEAGDRARALVKQILTFSRQSELEPKPVQVKLITKEVLKLVQASLSTNIEIEQIINSNATVMADPVQIHQVLMNLCTNAGHAMRSKGGTLTVRLDEVDLNEAFTNRHAELKPGTYLKLSVIDTGHGITADKINRIFDPFFTTKQKGEGTGMGLAVVHGIVTGLGGAVTVKSKPEQGARFDIYLPIIESEPALKLSQVSALPTGTEKILFVDDEVFQTDMLKQMLGLLGYTVETCNSSIEALAYFKQYPNTFDLVITDMIMPGMSGDKLAQKMLEIRPDLPIIVSTGYSEKTSEERARSMGIKAFVLKPLVMEELSRLIRQVLDGKEA